ncbi:hypothetical protein ACIBJE_06290 [Micromonospora sp. NPDC050187]|uniref:hypothetical protein n=1 Tax=Micromonospora sp. NPDC050187 TaxID=3364277 RepID=UPI0037A41A12
MDEADTVFGGKNADANEDLRGLLNAGQQRNRPAIRWDAGTQRLEKIPTVAVAALAATADVAQPASLGRCSMTFTCPTGTVRRNHWSRRGPCRRVRGEQEI